MKTLGLSLILSLCACASPGSSGADDFTGNWSGNITETFNCSQFSETDTYGDTLTVSQSGTDVVVQASDCSYTGTASGETITLDPGQVCPAYTDSQGTTTQLTVNSGTLTFDGQGNLDFSLSGTSDVTADSMNELVDSCDTGRSGSLTD